MRFVFFRVQMAEQNVFLRRIAEALERLSPPLPAHEPPARVSDLSDLRVVDSHAQRILEEIKEEFARTWNVEKDSEAYLKAQKAFEDEVRMGSGQEAVDQLPWNRIGKVDQ